LFYTREAVFLPAPPYVHCPSASTLPSEPSRYSLPDECENESCQSKTFGEIALPKGTPLVIERFEKAIKAQNKRNPNHELPQWRQNKIRRSVCGARDAPVQE